jgi:misacylated tRNA(Ala) deacylase
MTRLLCLEDGYQKECDALVISAEGGLILDQTVFYPRGGGQPSDTGTLSTASGSRFPVIDVIKKDGSVLHMIEGDASSIRTGDKVHCVIDWERRYALMRMHTAAHVLAGTMHSKLGARITGNQIDTEKTRFDFDLEDFDRERFDRLVGEANESLSRDTPLKVYSLPREEAMRIPGVVKLAGALPPSVTELRIVEIPGIDIQADGGTHVANLNEVGRIEILKLENKGKSNRRIYFTLRR